MATNLANIPLPAPLNTAPSHIASDWKRFSSQWTNYVKAAKLTTEPKDCQAAIFLACIGVDAFKIYETMELTTEQKEDPAELVEAFKKHCVGETNEVYERYVFHMRKQDSTESFDSFVTDLRRLVSSCGYAIGLPTESMIRDRIVLGVREDTIRKKLLATRGLTLQKAVDFCRAHESAIRQFEAMTSTETVNTLQRERGREQLRPRSPERSAANRPKSVGRSKPSARRAFDGGRRCHYCDRIHEPGRSRCPANGVECRKCGKWNHFAAVCRSSHSGRVQQLDTIDQGNAFDNEYDVGGGDGQQSGEYTFALNGGDGRRIYSHAMVNGMKLRFLLDCGATVNVLPKSVYDKIPCRPKIRPGKRLRMFNNTVLPTLGLITATLRHPRKYKSYMTSTST